MMMLATISRIRTVLAAGTAVAVFAVSVPALLAQESIVQVPHVISSSYPNSNEWYTTREASFSWDVPLQVNAVRTRYDDRPNSIPNKVYDPPVEGRTFTVEGDGIMYMHVQFREGESWGPIAHYRFQIDTIAPTDLSVSLIGGLSGTSPAPEVVITARDELSGVAYVEMSVDGGDRIRWPVSASNIYRLPKASQGNHTAHIAVYDRAGNMTDASLSYTIETLGPPEITSYTKRVGFMDDFQVAGVGYSRSLVEVMLVDAEDRIYAERAATNDKGEFVLRWKGELPRGAYEMKARMVDPRGAASGFTEPKIVHIESLGLMKFGVFVMNWLSLLIIAVLALAGILATAWYSFGRFGKFRRRVVRTMLEAEHTLKVNVQALRRDIEEFHDILVKTQKKRELTKEEQTIMKKLKKRLDIAEKEIEKKLESLQQ